MTSAIRTQQSPKIVKGLLPFDPIWVNAGTDRPN